MARLAGISTDYYTRLEQNRATARASEAVLRALTRALRLSLDERDHLYRLVGHPVPDRRHGDRHVSPDLLGVLDRMNDVPAQVMTDLGVVLVQNRLAETVFGEPGGAGGLRGSIIYRWFTDPASRSAYPVSDHLLESRYLAADLRATVARRADAAGAELVSLLLADSAEFAALWALQEVAVLRGRRKRIHHREVGLLELDCLSLTDEDRTHVLATFLPAPGTRTAERLALLEISSSLTGSGG